MLNSSKSTNATHGCFPSPFGLSSECSARAFRRSFRSTTLRTRTASSILAMVVVGISNIRSLDFSVRLMLLLLFCGFLLFASLSLRTLRHILRATLRLVIEFRTDRAGLSSSQHRDVAASIVLISARDFSNAPPACAIALYLVVPAEQTLTRQQARARERFVRRKFRFFQQGNRIFSGLFGVEISGDGLRISGKVGNVEDIYWLANSQQIKNDVHNSRLKKSATSWSVVVECTSKRTK